MSELMEREATELQVVDNNPAQFIKMALESKASIEQLKELMDMSKDYQADLAKKAFFTALVGFQSACPAIKKRKQAHNYLYAPLEDIIAQVKKHLTECNLSYRFEQSMVNHETELTCIITHKDGHSERTTMVNGNDASGSKNVIQAYGSTSTYLKRYTFISALGITTADEDIDGRLDSDVDHSKELEKLLAHAICVRENIDEIFEIKSKIANDDHVGAKMDWRDLGQEVTKLLWVAPTKGGIFTTSERDSIKNTSINEVAA